MTIAYYPGSFDPLTNGHLDVLHGALRIAASVVVGIGVHPNKVPLFSFDERKALIMRSAWRQFRPRMAVIEVRTGRWLSMRLPMPVLRC